MVWIRCIHCEKFRRHFVARPSALIAPVRPDLHRVSYSNKMVPKAPKHYKTDQNIGSNCIYRVPSLQKIRTRLRCTNFCINCTVWLDLHRVSCSNEMLPNAPKHYKTHQNMRLGSNGMDRVPSLRKITTPLRCTNFCINCTSSSQFAPSFIQ